MLMSKCIKSVFNWPIYPSSAIISALSHAPSEPGQVPIITKNQWRLSLEIPEDYIPGGHDVRTHSYIYIPTTC